MQASRCEGIKLEGAVMQKLSDIKEIKLEDLEPDAFIKQQVKEISAAVGKGVAINALSGGVDSSVVTMLGHRALGDQLRTVFIENGIMREGEPERVVKLFKGLGSRSSSWTPRRSSSAP
jgi:GMP synthase (glutamine-hydrolysing)